MTLSMWEQEKFEDGLSQGIDIGRAECEAKGRAEGRAGTLDAAAVFMRENGIPMELVSKFQSSFSQA